MVVYLTLIFIFQIEGVDTVEISDNGIKFIKKYEGLYLYWYDLDDGGLTAGYGTYVPYVKAKERGIKKNDKITQAQADQWLNEEVNRFVKGTNAQVTQYGFKLNQNQFDALVSYAYNRGLGNAKGTNGLRQLLSNSKTVADISKNIPIYWGTNQKYKKGLDNRRAAEKKLFDTPYTVTVVTKKEDDKVYSSPALEKEVTETLKSSGRRELIVKQAVSHGYSQKWLDKLREGTITNDDIEALALGVVLKTIK